MPTIAQIRQALDALAAANVPAWKQEIAYQEMRDQRAMNRSPSHG